MSAHVSHDIDLVVFDLDGVLVDSTACHAWAFDELWRLCGLTGPEYAEIAGRTTHDVVREYTAALSPDARQLDEWVAFKQTRTLECFERQEIAYPDAVTVLRALRQAGKTLALGTGASRARTDVILDRLQVRSWFEAVVTAEDVTRGKPDGETYRTAIDRAGGVASRAIVVEDSASGIASALAAGARAASVRTGVDSGDPSFVGRFDDLRAFAASLGVDTA